MLSTSDVKKWGGKKPEFQFSLCLRGFHHQGSILVKGDLLVQGVPLAGRVERGFGFACLFYKSFEKLWLPLKFRGRAAKISKKNPKKHRPSWVLKALSCPVPEGAVNCRAFQMQKSDY